MDWGIIASSRIDDLTKPKSSGRPTNHHVAQGREVLAADFKQMQKLVHQYNPVTSART